MDPTYWIDRWTEGRTGWHQSGPTPLMLKHWAALELPPHSLVLVPLAGKSHDMLWLASQGYRVRGVEISQVAIEQFFDECGLEPTITSSTYGRHYKSGDIEILCGDAFSLDERALRDSDAIFDRGALIALPPPMRRRYTSTLYAGLPSGCRGLLITLDYPQHEQAGPPFSVPEDEVQALLSRDWAIHLLEKRDIHSQRHDSIGDAVSTLHTAVYRLLRK